MTDPVDPLAHLAPRPAPADTGLIAGIPRWMILSLLGGGAVVGGGGGTVGTLFASDDHRPELERLKLTLEQHEHRLKSLEARRPPPPPRAQPVVVSTPPTVLPAPTAAKPTQKPRLNNGSVKHKSQ